MGHRYRTVVLALIVSVGTLSAAPAPGSLAAEAPSESAHVDGEVRDATGSATALMHLRRSVSMSEGLLRARRAGLHTGGIYRSIRVFTAFGPAPIFTELARSGLYSYIEYDAPLQYFGDTSHRATRGAQVLAGKASSGKVYDGKGVGVAVIDTGADGSHPDLEDRIVTNLKAICTTPLVGHGTCRGPRAFVPMQDTDGASGGGHGTHVAGTVAGTGAASQGGVTGAAPGASLHILSVGTVISVENALDGLDWVLANHDKVKPAIRVVNNSWGSNPSEYDAESDGRRGATWKLQRRLIKAGVAVVFAAGNSGGDGSRATTSAECVNPTPGLICVANYNDLNLGTRKGSIHPSSSRGQKGQPQTYPDIAAPGTEILASCRAHLPVCYAGGKKPTDNLYAALTGTSMAAPHIAGIAAQLIQADPRLTPAQVEYYLENTAFRPAAGKPYEAEPFNGRSPTSYAWGHGLVDALAALNAVLAAR